ncbi:MAG: hypothetical protein OEV67_16520 [Betaproteobacteria bacterium]|jgi:hypothetical protein|nr:hypothetical protein [Betaproteobacteria bacterium]
MDPRLKKRIYVFYFAGVLNLVLGFYVLFFGGDLAASTRNVMMFFFFGFAAVDFWFPQQLKKKYAEQLAEFQRQQREQVADTVENKSAENKG